MTWQIQPRFDRLPAEAGKGHVEGFDRRQSGLHAFEGRAERMPARVGESAFPKRVEVAWLVTFGFVFAKFVEGFVEKGHDDCFLPQSC